MYNYDVNYMFKYILSMQRVLFNHDKGLWGE